MTMLSVSVLFALSVTTMLAGCAGSWAELDGATPVQRSLPNKPNCMAPVAVPSVTAGEDARKALADHRAALEHANRLLVESAKWYDRVKIGFEAP